MYPRARKEDRFLDRIRRATVRSFQSCRSEGNRTGDKAGFCMIAQLTVRDHVRPGKTRDGEGRGCCGGEPAALFLTAMRRTPIAELRQVSIGQCLDRFLRGQFEEAFAGSRERLPSRGRLDSCLDFVRIGG